MGCKPGAGREIGGQSERARPALRPLQASSLKQSERAGTRHAPKLREGMFPLWRRGQSPSTASGEPQGLDREDPSSGPARKRRSSYRFWREVRGINTHSKHHCAQSQHGWAGLRPITRGWAGLSPITRGWAGLTPPRTCVGLVRRSRGPVTCSGPEASLHFLPLQTPSVPCATLLRSS